MTENMVGAEAVPYIGAGMAGMASLGGILVAWRRLKPQEKSDIAAAVQSVATAASTLLGPLENRIESLEKRIIDQEGVIGGLKEQNTDQAQKIKEMSFEIITLREENHGLRIELQVMKKPE